MSKVLAKRISRHTQPSTNIRGHTMKATYKKVGFNYLPAIKCSYSGNVKVLYGDVLATAKVAKKYAQIEINRLNSINAASN